MLHCGFPHKSIPNLACNAMLAHSRAIINKALRIRHNAIANQNTKHGKGLLLPPTDVYICSTL